MNPIITLVLSLVFLISVSQANNLDGLPEDISRLNRTQLNNDLYDLVESMKDSTSDKINLQVYIRQMFLLIWRLPLIDITTMHRYDSDQDKLNSGGPRVNLSECKRKLRVLSDRLKSEQTNGSSLIGLSNDYRLFNLLDSFGRPSASFLRGDIVWLGDYDQCIKATYNYHDSDTVTTTASRYCLAHVRWPKWRHTDGFKEWSYATIKSAVCLPIECDSIGAEQEDNKHIISQLMGAQFGLAYKDHQIGDIYCLPDQESPLRQWWLDMPATCCVIFFTIWLSMVAICTLLDLYKSRQAINSKLVDIFSVIRNTKKLFDTSSATTKQQQSDNNDEPQYPLVTIYQTNENSRISTGKRLIDLKYLHCVKVVTLFIIMRTHFFLLTTQVGRIYDVSVSFDAFDKYHLSFSSMAVNIFFMITGTITAYTLFSRFPLSTSNRLQAFNRSGTNVNEKPHQPLQSQPHALMRPGVWMLFCTNRYLRLMPLLVLLTLVMKYLAKYLSDGPLWDYGTSTGTNTHTCRQGSWLNTLFALMNFRLVYELCIPSAWYVAIDLQCAIIVTPLLIMAYIKAPRLTFFVSLVVPWFLYGLQFFMTETFIPDVIRKFTKYQPNSVASIALIFHEQARLYTATVPRAIYYSMGITTGFLLHNYEIKGVQFKNSRHLFCPLVELLRRPVISNWITVALSFTLIYFPIWSLSYISESYLILFSNIYIGHILLFITGILYSFIVPIILIQLSTGSLGNSTAMRKFLNWSGWLPLSRISLSFMLIDTIIVLVYLLRHRRTMILDIDMRITIMLALSLIIYFCAFIVYVIFEAPLRSCVSIIENSIMQLCGLHAPKTNLRSSKANGEPSGTKTTDM